ncbi:MAG: hypothetical protein QXD44_08590 [Candidatus Nezhaarchaeales archaeon]
MKDEIPESFKEYVRERWKEKGGWWEYLRARYRRLDRAIREEWKKESMKELWYERDRERRENK